MKVAIVGTAPSRGEAPFSDPSWEIWGQAQPDLPRVSRWFELHDLGMIEKGYQELWAWLRDCPVPLVIARADPRLPQATPYPRAAMLQRFGPYFFSCTVAWELALAISVGATEIALYGVNMEDGSEYERQRPGCQHFILLARALGIEVSLPATCGLMKPHRLYALEAPNPARDAVAQRQSKMAAEEDRLIAAILQSEKMLNQVRGAREALTFCEENWL